MKKFLFVVLGTIGIPILLLLGLFLYTDPFKTLHNFDINDIDGTNREYLSTELFKLNIDKYNYNSFVFSSSKGCGINTYTWKMHMQDSTAQPFLFQAWSESLTGVELKIQYLLENDIPINNALILLDIPGSFANNQLPKEALSMKHYMFTKQPKWIYNAYLFYNYCQKPSQWLKSIKKKINQQKIAFSSDLITNDWNANNYSTYDKIPTLDSLKECSDMTRRTFFENIKHKTDNDIKMSPVMLSAPFKEQLMRIKKMLEQNSTDYHIIITPAYCYTSSYINNKDLEELNTIFGEKRVHDFSKHYITRDYNYFTDPGHFGLRAGYIMLEEIYSDFNPEH